jgi:hypothetical protein
MTDPPAPEIVIHGDYFLGKSAAEIFDRKSRGKPSRENTPAKSTTSVSDIGLKIVCKLLKGLDRAAEI